MDATKLYGVNTILPPHVCVTVLHALCKMRRFIRLGPGRLTAARGEGLVPQKDSPFCKQRESRDTKSREEPPTPRVQRCRRLVEGRSFARLPQAGVQLVGVDYLARGRRRSERGHDLEGDRASRVTLQQRRCTGQLTRVRCVRKPHRL